MGIFVSLLVVIFLCIALFLGEEGMLAMWIGIGGVLVLVIYSSGKQKNEVKKALDKLEEEGFEKSYILGPNDAQGIQRCLIFNAPKKEFAYVTAKSTKTYPYSAISRWYENIENDFAFQEFIVEIIDPDEPLIKFYLKDNQRQEWSAKLSAIMA